MSGDLKQLFKKAMSVGLLGGPLILLTAADQLHFRESVVTWVVIRVDRQ